jgi:hypothetical protein
MEGRFSFSEDLSDLYAMQQLVRQQQQEGLRLVGFGDELNHIKGDDLHFFRDFGDILMRILENQELPNPLRYTSVPEFQQELDLKIAGKEEQLLRPLDKLIQEINSDLKMPQELEEKYFAKVFEQDVQQQMRHDLGNTYTYLIGEQQSGKEWVAYPDVEKVSQADMRTFATREAAQAYVVEHSNVAVTYDYNAIDRITGALTPLVQAAIDQHFDRESREPGKDPDKDNKKDRDRDQEMER